MTFGLELHAWKGVSLETDLFYQFIRLGFVTLGFSKHSVADQLYAMTALVAQQASGPDAAVIPHEGAGNV